MPSPDHSVRKRPQRPQADRCVSVVRCPPPPPYKGEDGGRTDGRYMRTDNMQQENGRHAARELAACWWSLCCIAPFAVKPRTLHPLPLCGLGPALGPSLAGAWCQSCNINGLRYSRQRFSHSVPSEMRRPRPYAPTSLEGAVLGEMPGATIPNLIPKSLEFLTFHGK
jgi:hypothetical protein